MTVNFTDTSNNSTIITEKDDLTGNTISTKTVYQDGTTLTVFYASDGVTENKTVFQ